MLLACFSHKANGAFSGAKHIFFVWSRRLWQYKIVQLAADLQCQFNFCLGRQGHLPPQKTGVLEENFAASWGPLVLLQLSQLWYMVQQYGHCVKCVTTLCMELAGQSCLGLQLNLVGAGNQLNACVHIETFKVHGSNLHAVACSLAS